MIQGGEQFSLDFRLQLQLPGWRLWAIGGKGGLVSSVGKYATVFRVELYKILNYVHETESKGRPEE